MRERLEHLLVGLADYAQDGGANNQPGNYVAEYERLLYDFHEQCHDSSDADSEAKFSKDVAVEEL